jgi:hypothetical protein
VALAPTLNARAVSEVSAKVTSISEVTTMATTNDKTATRVPDIRKRPPLPAELVALSREQLLARLAKLFADNPDLQVHECGRTDPYVSDNDLRVTIHVIEDLLRHHKARP